MEHDCLLETCNNTACVEFGRIAFVFPGAALCVNRQIHQEASEIFYRANPLKLKVPGLERRYTMGQRSRGLIETLQGAFVRLVMKEIVLKITLAHYKRSLPVVEDNPVVFYILETAAKELAAAVGLMAEGTALRSLKILVQPTDEYQECIPKGIKTQGIDLMEVFGPLRGLVHDVTITSNWYGSELAQLDLLREQLQILPHKERKEEVC